jgi:hypothetical protein
MSIRPQPPDTLSEKLLHYWCIAALVFVWLVIGGVYAIVANIEGNAALPVKLLGVVVCGVTVLGGLHMSALALFAPFSTRAAERVDKVFPPDEKPQRAPHPSPDPVAAGELTRARALHNRGVRVGLIGVAGVLLCSLGANAGGVVLALSVMGGLLSLVIALLGIGMYGMSRGRTFRRGSPKPAPLAAEARSLAHSE